VVDLRRVTGGYQYTTEGFNTYQPKSRIEIPICAAFHNDFLLFLLLGAAFASTNYPRDDTVVLPSTLLRIVLQRLSIEWRKFTHVRINLICRQQKLR